MKTLHIFRAGRHTPKSGGKLDFSEADLAGIAASYDPARHEAPIVVGHPRHDRPAYGWIKSLKATAEGLEAEPSQVDPAFSEIVNDGRYKKISASFFAPTSPANPTPGKWYLRHVGFLGAAAPAVPGLRSASFSENPEGVVEFELSPRDFRWRTISQVFRKLREFVLEKYGLDAADKIAPNWLVEDLATPPDEAAFTETEHETNHEETNEMPTPEELKKKEDELAAREAELAKKETEFSESAKKAETEAEAKKTAEFSEREEALAKREAELAKKEHADFVEGLAKEGKVLPREKGFLVEFMAALDDETTVEFSEGEGAEPKKGGLLSLFRESLEARPKMVDFSERSADDGSGAGDDVDAEAKAIAEAR